MKLCVKCKDERKLEQRMPRDIKWAVGIDGMHEVFTYWVRWNTTIGRRSDWMEW